VIGGYVIIVVDFRKSVRRVLKYGKIRSKISAACEKHVRRSSVAYSGHMAARCSDASFRQQCALLRGAVSGLL